MDTASALAPVVGVLDSPGVVALANTFFALLALLVNVITLVVVGLLVARPSGARLVLQRARDAARVHGVGAAAAVTGTATLGSLYYSEIVGFIPCRLCWFQRIFMYPLAVILTVALVRHLRSLRGGAAPDTPARTDVWRYAVPLAVVGLPISIWHWLIERFPGLESGACDPIAPCSAIYVERFGFVSLPWMAGTGFAFVLAVALLLRRTPSSQPVGDEVHDLATHRRMPSVSTTSDPRNRT